MVMRHSIASSYTSFGIDLFSSYRASRYPENWTFIPTKGIAPNHALEKVGKYHNLS